MREQSRGQYAVPEALETVNAKIKAAGGSTVYAEDLPVNDWGTFSGEFQLAPEPPLGDYELVTIVGQEPMARLGIGMPIRLDQPRDEITSRK